MTNPSSEPVFIAVTGAQGVGKSTLCKKLQEALAARTGHDVTLLDSLGNRIRAAGFKVGSAATPDSVSAIFDAHEERQNSAPNGYVILDRCGVDALAYVRHLGVNSEQEIGSYEERAKKMIGIIHLAVHLKTSETFADGGSHETPILRQNIGEEIPRIIAELKVRAISVDAASLDCLDTVVSACLALERGR